GSTCTPLAFTAHLVLHWVKRLAERLVECSAVGGSANGVQLEIPIRDAEPVEQRSQHFQHFRVASGRFASSRCGPDYFCPDLIELPIAAFLRALTTKLRADVVELVNAAIPKFVLDIGTDDARRIFRTES